MTNRIADISPRKVARVAGLGYLIIIIAGIFAEFIVRSSLIVPGDATTTANNILASEWLFRTGIAGDLIMLLCDVVVAAALFILLKPVSRGIALLAAFFRLVHAAVYGANLLNLFFILRLLSGTDYLTVFETEQLHALVLFFLNGHSTGYLIGLVFFGLHCFVLGYLILKSGYIPKILGVLLMVASLGYLTDSFANILLLNYEAYETIFLLVVFVPAFVAELSLCLWLLLKGVNVPRTELNKVEKV
jgi:hypothetical protein